MFKRTYLPFVITIVISLIFLAAIAVNLSPYLLGPGIYPPDWRWTYQLSNTLSRIWFPVLVILSILFLAYRTEKTSSSKIKKKRLLLLLTLIILGFLLQLSLLFYSRAGLGVLVHRITNPLISGYFTASLDIHSIPEFIRNYNQNLGGYPMYARFHPPGAILFFNLITAVSQPLSIYFSSVLNHMPSHVDVALIWQGLSLAHRLSAIISGFTIILLANIAIVPLYFCSRLLYGERVALRSTFLFLFVPSILLFTPLNDVFLPIFTAASLYYFLKGLKHRKNKYFFISGFVLFVGAFFSLTFLSLILFFLLLFLLTNLKKKKRINLAHFTGLGVFLTGFAIVPAILFIFELDFIQMTQKIMQYHVLAQNGREYLAWFFYNIYDFLLFAGIPLGLSFIYQIYGLVKSFAREKRLVLRKADPVFFAFLLMLFAVDVSGAVRAETARIWTPYIPIFILISASFLTNKLNLKQNAFIFLLTVQAAQVLIFQTVLVTVW